LPPLRYRLLQQIAPGWSTTFQKGVHSATAGDELRSLTHSATECGIGGCLVGLGRRTFALGTRRAKRRLTAFRSPLAAFVVALSLVVQLFAAATPPAIAAPAFAGADDAAIAAQLKALFGDTAQLCVQVNDDKAPAKHAPSSHCCDQCPLCRFAAQAVAFVSPDLPALPGRLDGEAHAIRAPPVRDVLPPYPAQPNPARAPPLAV
jgi:hypothetical protein